MLWIGTEPKIRIDCIFDSESYAQTNREGKRYFFLFRLEFVLRH